MSETTQLNGIPVPPGSALAALVGSLPKELLTTLPVSTLSALAGLPAAALTSATQEGPLMAGAFEKALMSISSTAAAAQAATATLALNHAIMAAAAKLKL